MCKSRPHFIQKVQTEELPSNVMVVAHYYIMPPPPWHFLFEVVNARVAAVQWAERSAGNCFRKYNKLDVIYICRHRHIISTKVNTSKIIEVILT